MKYRTEEVARLSTLSSAETDKKKSQAQLSRRNEVENLQYGSEGRASGCREALCYFSPAMARLLESAADKPGSKRRNL